MKDFEQLSNGTLDIQAEDVELLINLYINTKQNIDEIQKICSKYSSISIQAALQQILVPKQENKQKRFPEGIKHLNLGAVKTFEAQHSALSEPIILSSSSEETPLKKTIMVLDVDLSLLNFNVSRSSTEDMFAPDGSKKLNKKAFVDFFKDPTNKEYAKTFFEKYKDEAEWKTVTQARTYIYQKFKKQINDAFM